MKENIERISRMIFRLSKCIEHEFDDFEDVSDKERLKHKRVITSNLAKLVKLTIQLQKISKEAPEDEQGMSGEDQQIIENYLKEIR